MEIIIADIVGKFNCLLRIRLEEFNCINQRVNRRATYFFIIPCFFLRITL